MDLITLDLTKKKINDFSNVINECENILYENLDINGGLLKQKDIFKKDFKWKYLIVAKTEDEIIGFSLIRNGVNQYDIDGEFYYLSEIVLKNKYKKNGVGSLLLHKSIELCSDKPFVASVLKNNSISIKLLLKYMSIYSISPKGNYYRFVDNNTYNKNMYNEKKYGSNVVKYSNGFNNKKR